MFELSKPEDLDPTLQVGQRRIGGDSGFKRVQRVRLAIEREERFAASDERGHIVVLLLDRAIEMRERSPGIFSRQRDVAQRGFGRVERP